MSATEFVRSVGRCTFQNDSAHSFLNSWRDIRIQPPAREPTTVMCIFLSEIQRQNKNKTNCKPTQHLSYRDDREYNEVLLPLTYTCRQRSNTHTHLPLNHSLTRADWRELQNSPLYAIMFVVEKNRTKYNETENIFSCAHFFDSSTRF